MLLSIPESHGLRLVNWIESGGSRDLSPGPTQPQKHYVVLSVSLAPSGFRVQTCGEAWGISASWDSRWPWIGLGIQALPPGSPFSTASTP